MPETLNLNYYYGNEADQYSFYRIPKILLTDRRYKGVSLEAKVLYGLLLDRMGLSARNGWLDDNGRVFLYFTQEEAMAIANDRMGVQYCPGGVTHLPEKRLFDALLAIIRKHAEVVVGTHTKLKQQDYKITAKKAEMTAEISKLQQETERNRVFLTSLYENFVTGILTGTEYHEMKAGYTQKIETAVLRVQQLQSEQKALEAQIQRWISLLPATACGLLKRTWKQSSMRLFPSRRR